MRKSIFFVLLLAVLTGCSGQTEWYKSETSAAADVFYICSTDVLSAGDTATVRVDPVAQVLVVSGLDTANTL